MMIRISINHFNKKVIEFFKQENPQKVNFKCPLMKEEIICYSLFLFIK